MSLHFHNFLWIPNVGNCFVSFIGLNTFGSGEWLAFAYNNEDWELKKFDSEDDALSLCTFKSKYDFLLLVHAQV